MSEPARGRAPRAEGEPPADISPEDPGQMVSVVALDMDAYAAAHGNKAVRKNVTIPAWLDTWAEKAGINYSGTLRDALESQYAAQLQAT